MMQHSQKTPVYSSKAFVVETCPQNAGTQLTKLRSHAGEKIISVVTFSGDDSELFLTGLSNALERLPQDEVEVQYLNRYGPLMQNFLLH